MPKQKKEQVEQEKKKKLKTSTTKDEKPSVINFYTLRNQWGFMSNFYRKPIKVDGKVWKTSEHYFQAMKFEGTKYEDIIRDLKTPMEAMETANSEDLDYPLREVNYHYELKI